MAEGQVTEPLTKADDASTAFGCLVLIGRLHGLHLTIGGLRADNRLGPGEPQPVELAACAESAGFRCKVLSLDWGHLRELKRALPAIVRMRDGRSMVLSRIEDHEESSHVTLQDPATDAGHPLTLSRTDFAATWSGEVLLLKKAVAADDNDDRPFGWRTIGAIVRGQGNLSRDLILSSAVLAILALAPILFAQALAGDVLDRQVGNTFMFLSIGILVLLVFEGAFALVRQGLVTRLSTRVGLQLDTLIFDRVLRLPITVFETTPKGLLAHRMGRALAVQAMLQGPLTVAMIEVGIVIVFVPAMLFASLILTVVVGVLAAAAIGLAMMLNGRFRRATTALDAAEADAAVLLTQTLGGFRTVKSLALEGRQRRRWDVLTARATRLRLAEADAGNALRTTGQLIERLMVFGVFALGVVMTISDFHPLSRAELFGFLLMTWRIATPLRDLAGLVRPWNEGRDALGDLSALANQTPEIARGRIGARAPVQGRIAFQAVHFTYPDAPVPALKFLSFEVAEGTMVGITGRSGAGKSTAARLLQRLHGTYQGLIKLDGIDVREFDIDHLRASVAVVGQDSRLFAGTIRENLTPARPEATQGAVVRAVRLVGAETFVERLPRGYDTVLDETASMLSDGQRQRLAIARAILADPSILILDEATSALDPDSEAVLIGNLKAMASGRTIIVISQRFGALMQADTILVLDRGEVQDIGRHQDLIGRSDLYSGLWRRQTARLGSPPPDARLTRGSNVA